MNLLNKLMFLLIFTIGFYSMPSYAQNTDDKTNPIEWQRVELLSKISGELTRSFEAIVQKSKFLVHVNVKLSAVKSFGASSSKRTKKNFPLAKLGISKNSSAYKRAISIRSTSVFDRISTVNIDIRLDRSVTAQQEKYIRQFSNNIVSSYTKKIPKIKVNRIVFLNDNFSRSRKLELARVNVEAAKQIGNAITQSNAQVAKVIAESNIKIAEAINAVEGRPTDSSKPSDTAVAKKPDFPTDWKELLVLFKIPLGVLIAAFLFSFFISGFKRTEKQKVALMAAANQQAVAASTASESANTFDEPEEKVSHDIDPSLASSSIEPGKNGFDQFSDIVAQYPDEATYFIKLWLNMDTSSSREALAVLPKMIPVESLVPIYTNLGDQLKSEMKNTSLTVLDAGSIQRAESFIIEQLVNSFLVNTIELPSAVKATLSNMTIQQFAECTRRDMQLGVTFINILQTGQIGRLLSLLSEDEITELFDNGLNYNSESIPYLESKLGPILTELNSETHKDRAPLVDKSIELIDILGPEREDKVFHLLISSGETQRIIEATDKFFPAELIMSFPVDQLRILLGKLKPKDRAALIYSRSSEDQKTFLKAIGETGRLRDIIDSELSEIKNNKNLQSQILKNKSNLWLSFIKLSRSTIKTDSRVKDTASDILTKWLQDNGVDTSEDHDELAA